MQMSATDQTTFPKLKQYVKNELPKLAQLPIIRAAMLEIGQINHALLLKVLKFGQGPTLRVTPLIGAVG